MWVYFCHFRNEKKLGKYWQFPGRAALRNKICPQATLIPSDTYRQLIIGPARPNQMIFVKPMLPTKPLTDWRPRMPYSTQWDITVHKRS